MDKLKAAAELGYSCQLEDDGSILKSSADGVLSNFTSSELATIDARAIELQAEYDSQDYSRKRKAAYAELNQFELLYDKGIAGWKSDIKAIKDLYPKP